MQSNLLFVVLLLSSSSFLFSQNNPWNFIDEIDIEVKQDSKRWIVPEQYQTLKLDIDQIKPLLKKAPLRGTEEAKKKEVFLDIPLPNGAFEQFRIFYTPVMHEDLAAKYPMIRSYSGYSVSNPSVSICFDLTQKGFHGYIRSAEMGQIFIDPYADGQTEDYISYFKKDFQKEVDWQCMVEEASIEDEHESSIGTVKMAADNQHRTYALALACTGEYAAFHGGNKPAVMAAFTTTMTRVNGVTENEFSVRMTMVANNDDLIFLNAGTDPYTNNDGDAMLGENQTTCDNEIGSANYDVGHVFSTGGGGIATLGCFCDNSQKAEGVTGQSSPVGDPFDIDFVAHEMGHQLGGNHTQNNACNRNSATAIEPGSASTIMGYAGICSPNVQNNSDDYYSVASIEEITTFIAGDGDACADKMTINNLPTADAGADYTIPKSTHFVLTGSGTDPDSDPITYCWEQIDNQVATTMPPVASSTIGPMFRSLSPTTSPDRYFPTISAIVSNSNPTWEVLPSNGRMLNFTLTVRDNHAGGGATKIDTMKVTIEGSAGPFLVTAPNTNVTWQALSNQTVTWDVAGTTAAPVSAANVDIFLSTDGGLTYPITVLAGTPNDGSQVVTIPNNQTSNARIMVRGAGNIFFDISNEDFTISPPSAGFSLVVSPSSLAVCTPDNGVFDIDISAFGGFNGDVDLSVTGVPSGASAAFSVDPVAAPGMSQLTVSNTGSVPSGSYSLEITATSGGVMLSQTVTLVITNGLPAAVSLIAPANGATGEPVTPTLSWNAATGATSYEIQVASDVGFSNLVVNETGHMSTSYNVSGLAANTTYYWRVRAANGCGNGGYSAVYDFTTIGITCSTFSSTDVPKDIDTNSSNGTITSVLNISSSGNIDDVDVSALDITHSWIDDLRIKLKSPDGTEITLVDQVCFGDEDMLIKFDDESSNNHGDIPCPPTDNNSYKPANALTAFDGKDINGTWTLTVEDLFAGSSGTLNAWSLDVCFEPTTPLSLNMDSTNIACNGAGNGTATALPSGGSGGYTYSWSNGGSTQTISNLGMGTYTVTVTSGSDMIVGSVMVEEPSAMNLTVNGTDPTNVNNGSATANVSGGTPPYSYEWMPTGTTSTINNIGQGTYAVTVTDDNDCTKNGSVYLQCPNNMTIDAGTALQALFHADNAITTDGAVILPNGTTTDFKAGDHIDLNELFEVEQGAIFTASIEGCILLFKEDEVEDE